MSERQTTHEEWGMWRVLNSPKFEEIVESIRADHDEIMTLRQRVAELEAVIVKWENAGEHHLMRISERIAVDHGEIMALRHRVGELEAGYAVAIEDIDSWAAYAPEYFQRKHDLSGCVKRHKKILSREGGSDE